MPHYTVPRRPLTDAQQRLVADELPHVRLIVLRLWQRGKLGAADQSTVESAVHVGMLEAVRLFDSSRGKTFRAYAVQRSCWQVPDDLRRHEPNGHRRHQYATSFTPARVLTESAVTAEDSDFRNPASPFATITADPADDPLRQTAARDGFHAMVDRICRDRRERLILLLLYQAGMTMREAGRVLSLSESRVSQIHTSLIERGRAIIERSAA